MCVSFFSASAEKSVFKIPCVSCLPSSIDAHPIAMVFVVATFAAAPIMMADIIARLNAYFQLVSVVVFASRFPPRPVEHSGLGTERHTD